MKRLEVHLSPELIAPERFADGTVVVIDVLRATTTIAHALAAGATAVVPCLTIEEAQTHADKLTREEIVLGGERGGERIDGFDLGNSPAEYSPARVGGKTLVFTTTNGTRALHHARSARRVVTGSFVNLSATLGVLRDEEAIHLLCAGASGEIALEDALCAGALAERFYDGAADEWAINDEARLAIAAYQQAARGEGLAAWLTRSLGGRNLLPLGLETDIADSARIDAAPVVAELNKRDWRIVSR